MVRFGGIVTSVRNGFTKKGDPYMIINLEDQVGKITGFVWSDAYDDVSFISQGDMCFLEGFLTPDRNSDDLNITVTSATLMDDSIFELAGAIFLRTDEADLDAILLFAEDAYDPGSDCEFKIFKHAHKCITVDPMFCVDLINRYGTQNVRFQCRGGRAQNKTNKR
jgi:DNA polymerase III alpha subunit